MQIKRWPSYIKHWLWSMFFFCIFFHKTAIYDIYNLYNHIQNVLYFYSKKQTTQNCYQLLSKHNSRRNTHTMDVKIFTNIFLHNLATSASKIKIKFFKNFQIYIFLIFLIVFFFGFLIKLNAFWDKWCLGCKIIFSSVRFPHVRT